MKMPLSFLLLLCILTFGANSPSAFSQDQNQKLLGTKVLPRKPVNAEERKVFQQFGAEWTYDQKTYINPPVGRLSADVKKTEEYYNGVMKKLLEQKPFDGEVKVKINFYAENQFSIYSESLKEKEDKWLYDMKKINRDWPMRRFLGAKNKATPLFEIGISNEFLRKVKSEDEVAFFLAKELSSIREQLYNPDFEKGRMAAAQVESTAGDVEALDWMRRSGYNPEASLDALDHVYASADPKWKGYPVLDALKGDSHQGVRYSAVQAQLENLKRKSVSGLKQGSIPIPAYTKLNHFPRQLKKLKEEDYQKLRAEFKKVVLQDFNVDQPSQYFIRQGLNKPSSANKDFAALERMSQASEEQAGKLFKEALGWLEASNASKQTKGNAAMRLLTYFNPNVSGQHPALYLSDDDLLQVVKKFKTFSTGKDGWKAQQYLKVWQLDHDESGKFFLKSPGSSLQDPTYQKIYSRLYNSDSEYKAFLKSIPDLEFMGSTDQSIANSVVSHILNLDDLKESPFKQQLINDAFEKLKTLSLTEAAKATDGLNLYATLSHLAEKAKTESLKARVHPFVEETKKAYQAQFEKRIVEFFAKPITNMEEVTSQLNELNHVMKRMAVSLETLEKATQYLVKYAKETAKNPMLIPKDWFSKNIDAMDGPISKLYGSALRSSSYSTAEKQMLIDFILGTKDPAIGLKLSRPETKELLKAMQEQVQSMTPKELHSWVGRDIRANYRSELSNLLSKAQKFPIGDTDAELKRLTQALKDGKAGHGLGLKGSDFGTTKLDTYMDEISKNQYLYSTKIEYMIQNPIQKNLNILSVMGSDREFSQKVIQKYKFADLQKLITIIDHQRERGKMMILAAEGFVDMDSQHLIVVDNKGGTFLLDLFEKVQGEAPTLDAWYSTFIKIKKASPVGVREDWQTADRLGAILFEKVRALPPAEIKLWLKKEGVMDLIPQEDLVSLLRQTMPAELLPAPGAVAKDRTLLANEVNAINSEYELQKKYPQAYTSLQKNLAEEFLLQPGETEAVFKDLSKTTGQNVRFASNETRALSGLVSLSHQQSVQDQIDLIEYLMGRKEEPPAFIYTAGNDMEQVSSIPEYVRETRTRLAAQGELERAMVTNSFLAGPESFMETEQGLNEMVDYLLKGVTQKNKGVANELAQALIRSEGRNRSLGVAYVLGQKAVEGGTGLAESRILKSLFEAYGVPGIKLGQYLAFTSELKDYKAVLEELQDSAMPLKYLDAVKLCEERFGAEWPSKIQITGIKGSGSVNVALTYKELDTGKTGVFSILRSNIENSTKHDFFRFQNFIKELTKTPEGLKKYGYLAGLSDVIEASVGLEFDKTAALKMQQYVGPMYHEKVNGWNVQTIDAFEEKNKAVFMQEAPGKGARKIFAQDPESYKGAMKALSQVEMDRLLGIGPDGRPKPVPLYANPDFHDGQVLMDVPNKKVTLLDFGQAVKISNEERELGVDLLRIISKVESPEKAARILNSGILKSTGKTISATELTELLSRSERMDIFIKLLSTLGQKKMNVPLSTVHWVLAANRQIALGEKIGVNNLQTFRNIVIADKVGVGQRTYNWLRLGRRKVCSAMGVLKDVFIR